MMMCVFHIGMWVVQNKKMLAHPGFASHKASRECQKTNFHVWVNACCVASRNAVMSQCRNQMLMKYTNFEHNSDHA